jgi:hypothetical protein
MMRPAGKALPDDPPLLHAAIELGPRIRAASDEMERLRRIPPELAQAMKDAGVFGMVLPRSWGAPELDPLNQIRVIEALAIAEGSAGWCAMIGCDSGYITAFLDEDVAHEMYPDIWVATAATATATGQATPVPGGYQVSGRFPFASGRGWVVTSFTMAFRVSAGRASRKLALALCGSLTVKFSIPGIRRACAARAVTISRSTTYSCPLSTLSAFRMLTWSSGRGRCMPFRSCSLPRARRPRSELPGTRSMSSSRTPRASRRAE